MPEARPIHPGLFVDAADGPRLLAGRCAACDRLHFPASHVCPYCGADAAGTAQVGGTGLLYLWTVVNSRPPGYGGPLPFGFGVVELPDAGLRVVTRLASTRLDELRERLPMRLILDTLFTDDEGRPVVTWAYRPEDA
jgi:uncharacterized OB-fold protein